jgi:outer membrane protein assembly factor BamB
MRLFALAILLSTLGGAVLGCGAATARRVTDDQREMPANVAHLRWRTVIHEHNMFEAKPEECATGVVVGSRVIVGSRAGKVVGLATSDGRTLWNTGISGGSDGEARFDQARNQVYVGSDDGYLYAIDTDGKIRWSYKSKGSIDRMPELGGDLVYAATSTDRVVSLDAATGKYRWGYEREVPEGFTIHGHAGPRLHEGMLFAGFSDGYLVALSAAGGEVVWARSLAAATDQFVDVDTTPAFVGDLVVASSYSGGLYALRARDGDVRWRLNIEGASALRLTEGRLYVAAPREGLAALTPDGQFIWRQGLAEAGDLTPPTAVGPYLVFSGSRAGLFIVERASGKLLQLFNPGRGACAAPAIDAADNHRLYLLANSGSLYALDLVY